MHRFIQNTKSSASSSPFSHQAKKVDWSDDSNIIREHLPRITHDLVHRLVSSSFIEINKTHCCFHCNNIFSS